MYGATAHTRCSNCWLPGAPPANEVSCPRPRCRNTSITNSRSLAPAYPAPNIVPERVVPVMCGTPSRLSRTIVTSGRGENTLSTWLPGTPNEASLKKPGSCASLRPA